MDSYSHGAFEVSGYKVAITNSERMVYNIQAAWATFMAPADGGVKSMSESVENKAYPHLHTVYYNFVDPTGPKLGYDMIIGYATTDGSVQSDPRITTLTIPAQNYKYKKVTGNPKETLGPVWAEINAMPKSEVARTYGYDMEMYSEDGNEVTVAVSVL
jgi:hypothetical protein